MGLIFRSRVSHCTKRKRKAFKLQTFVERSKNTGLWSRIWDKKKFSTPVLASLSWSPVFRQLPLTRNLWATVFRLIPVTSRYSLLPSVWQTFLTR